MLALELLGWLEDCAVGPLQSQLAATPPVPAFLLRAAQSLADPLLLFGALHVAERLVRNVHNRQRSGLDPLVPLAARLVVDPLHPWPPGSPMRPASPERQAEAVAQLEREAVNFVSDMMDTPREQERVLAAAPGCWEALVALYRRYRAAGNELSETLHCTMLIAGKLVQVGRAVLF